MSMYSNDNISKIAKLTTRELPHLAKTAKMTVRKNNGVYSMKFSDLSIILSVKPSVRNELPLIVPSFHPLFLPHMKFSDLSIILSVKPSVRNELALIVPSFHPLFLPQMKFSDLSIMLNKRGISLTMLTNFQFSLKKSSKDKSKPSKSTEQVFGKLLGLLIVHNVDRLPTGGTVLETV